jgi:hypothetical protein
VHRAGTTENDKTEPIQPKLCVMHVSGLAAMPLHDLARLSRCTAGRIPALMLVVVAFDNLSFSGRGVLRTTQAMMVFALSSVVLVTRHLFFFRRKIAFYY